MRTTGSRVSGPGFRVLTVSVLMLVGAACPGPKSGQASAGRDTATKTLPVVARLPLEPWLDSVRKAHEVPGLVAVVLRSDSVIATVATGVRRSGTTSPLTIHDRFQIGSNTKAMTASVLASLVEEGKLSWTSTPLDVFPERRDSISRAFRTITIEQLLAHRAGISPFTNTNDKDWKSAPEFTGDAIQRRAQFVYWLLSGTPVEPPGTKTVYSNAGYSVAAVMAERVSGKTWEDLIRERVFRPLGMTGAFSWGDSVDVEQPWGHFKWPFGLRALDPTDGYHKVPSIIWPAGSVEVSPVEYAKFLQANLRALRGSDTPLHRVATVRRLHSPLGGLGNTYALGWGRQMFEGDSASTHAGSAGAFYAVAMIVPSRDVAVAVIANAGNEASALATRDALRALVRLYRLPADSMQ